MGKQILVTHTHTHAHTHPHARTHTLFDNLRPEIQQLQVENARLKIHMEDSIGESSEGTSALKAEVEPLMVATRLRSKRLTRSSEYKISRRSMRQQR